MKELQIVSFEQAERLKKLGFNWDVNTGWRILPEERPETYPRFRRGFIRDTIMFNMNEDEDTVSAPTTALALKWMRYVKNVQNGITYFETIDGKKLHYYGRYQTADFLHRDTKVLDTHEEAESALLDAILNDLDKLKQFGYEYSRRSSKRMV